MAEYQRPAFGDAKWYVASCRDGDAHLARSVTPATVTPLCGRAPFHPFAALSRPSDPEQGCTGCLTAKAHQLLVAERAAAARQLVAQVDLVSD